MSNKITEQKCVVYRDMAIENSSLHLFVDESPHGDKRIRMDITRDVCLNPDDAVYLDAQQVEHLINWLHTWMEGE